MSKLILTIVGLVAPIFGYKSLARSERDCMSCIDGNDNICINLESPLL
jgi:hypothetical protein